MSKNIRKTILKSIGIVVLYLILLEGLKATLIILVRSGFFEGIDNNYISFIETAVYIFLISILYLILRRGKKDITIKRGKPKVFQLVIILVLPLLYTIIEDPFRRSDIILGYDGYPSSYSQFSFIEQVALAANVVILGSVFEELMFREGILKKFLPEYKVLGTTLSSFLIVIIHINLKDINALELVSAFCISLILGLIYIKYGVLYSILFHSGYNLIWLLKVSYSSWYWHALEILDFGLIYWFMFSCSLIFTFLALQSLMSKSTPTAT